MRTALVCLCFLQLLKNCNNFELNYFIERPDITNLVLGEKVAELLRLFENYERLFYIDDDSAELYESARKYFRSNKKKLPLFIYNFDRSGKVRARPKIANIVHVVFSENTKMWSFLNDQNKINHRDIVVFVTKTEEFREVIVRKQENTIRLAGRTLVLEGKVGHGQPRVSLYKVCFYCGSLKNHFQAVNFTTLSPETPEILPDNYKDLNGHQLNLVFMSNYPFAYCTLLKTHQSKKICLSINGIESHMIKLISRKMNFSFVLYEIDTDGSSYHKMLKNMEEDDSDIAFGAISMTLNRRNLIEFTTQYHAENFNLLYKTGLTFLDVLEKFFDPFSSPILWVLLLMAYFFVAVILYLMQVWREQKKIKLKECFWILLQIQLEQAVSGDSFKSASKRSPCWGAMLILWCACCMVLCAAYKGATLSALVRPSRSEPESLAELVSEGYRIVASNKSFDIIQDSLNVSDPIYQKTMKRMEYGSTSCEDFAEVVSTRTALLNEWSMIQFQIRNLCKQPSAEVLKQIRVARQPVMTAGHAWATRLGAPFKQAIDFYLGLILSGGLFEKWRQDHTQTSGKRVKHFRLSRDGEEIQNIILTLQTFYPLFLIYGIGICCAIISFVYEVIRFNYVKIKIYHIKT